MKLNRKRITTIVGAAMVTASVFTMGGLGVASAADKTVTAPTGQTIFIIPKDTINPYEVQADDGAATVIGNAGDTAVVDSGTTDGPTSQIPAIQSAIADHASAIIIAADDPDAICPSIAQAEAAGITVVGFDSDFDCPNHLFINQAVTQTIGESEVTILAKEIPKATGQIAILSAASTAANQNSWIKYMKIELKKYPKLKLVSTVYGNDDPATSLTVLKGLLAKYPKLAGIISPTTVGISTAAQYLDTHKKLLKHLHLTGLGLPSQMKPYVLDGTCPEFELWNPIQLGQLAAYAALELDGSKPITTDTVGSVLYPTASVGSGTATVQGTWTIAGPAAGTTDAGGSAPAFDNSVILGPPFVFTKANVSQFNF
jgi:rhamnose transport system substrate-binding protein